jgi:hypothetical protein
MTMESHAKTLEAQRRACQLSFAPLREPFALVETESAYGFLPGAVVF